MFKHQGRHGSEKIHQMSLFSVCFISFFRDAFSQFVPLEVKEQLKRIEEAAKLQSNWVKQANSLQTEEGVDIKEHLTEEEFQEAEKKHRERARRERRSKPVEKMPANATHEEVMAMLDRLEKEEEEEEGSSDGG